MIAPEPTEVVHVERWRAPWDLGIDPDRVISCIITPADGVGFAGHLGVTEMQCPGPHAEEAVLVWDLLPCPHCGAVGTDMPPDPWGVMADRAPIAKARRTTPGGRGDPYADPPSR